MRSIDNYEKAADDHVWICCSSRDSGRIFESGCKKICGYGRLCVLFYADDGACSLLFFDVSKITEGGDVIILTAGYLGGCYF